MSIHHRDEFASSAGTQLDSILLRDDQRGAR